MSTQVDNICYFQLSEKNKVVHDVYQIILRLKKLDEKLDELLIQVEKGKEEKGEKEGKGKKGSGGVGRGMGVEGE